MLPRTIQYVDTVPARMASGQVRQIYAQVKAEMGLLPEAVTLFSADPRLLAATWVPLRESLLATGVMPRSSKEAVAATVSAVNQCPYCVDAHTIMLYGSGGGSFATGLLTGAGDQGEPELRAVADWVRQVAVRPDAPVPAPFPAEAVPEMIGVLVHFHFLNRAIDVVMDGSFMTGGDRARAVTRRVVGRAMARRIRARKNPGTAVGLVAGGVLPPDLSWAAPAPGIAAAFAMLAGVAEEARGPVVPPAVDTLVEKVLDDWDGRFPGPSRAWLDELTASLAAADRPAGRLALLTALAPFQCTAADVAAFRAGRPADGELLALLTWAAFAAARRIGAWAVPAEARPG